MTKKNINVPLIGDFHFNGHKLLSLYPECAQALSKYRINPGNVGVKRKKDINTMSVVYVLYKSQKHAKN